MMNCNFYKIAETKNGCLMGCRCVSDRVTLMFGNICQVFKLDQYLKLYRFIQDIDEDFFFANNPTDVMYIATEQTSLYFAFTKPEIKELKILIEQARFTVSSLYKVHSDKN